MHLRSSVQTTLIDLLSGEPRIVPANTLVAILSEQWLDEGPHTEVRDRDGADCLIEHRHDWEALPTR